MSYSLYKAEVHFRVNGSTEKRFAISVDRDSYNSFLVFQKKRNPSVQYGTADQFILKPVNGNFYKFVKDLKDKGEFGVWEDEIPQNKR